MSVKAAGELDLSFANAGKLIVGGKDNIFRSSTLVLSDGKFLIVGFSSLIKGAVTLARFDADGQADLSYGEQGIVTDILQKDSEEEQDLPIKEVVGIVDDNDMVTVVVYVVYERYRSTLLAARYDSAGNRNTNFGLPVLHVKTGDNRLGGLALQLDGKLVATVNCNTSPWVEKVLITRLTMQGKPDNDFGAAGVVYPVRDINYFGRVAVQLDGKLLVCASDRIVRLLANGERDQTFGKHGVVTIAIPGYTSIQAASLVVDDHNNIIVAGSVHAGDNISGLFLKLKDNGDQDTIFNRGKPLIHRVGDGNQNFEVLLQKDGRIIAVGYTLGTDVDATAVRLIADGTFDNDFGRDGVVKLALIDGVDLTTFGVLQGDGKLLVSGYGIGKSGELSFIAARLLTF